MEVIVSKLNGTELPPLDLIKDLEVIKDLIHVRRSLPVKVSTSPYHEAPICGELSNFQVVEHLDDHALKATFTPANDGFKYPHRSKIGLVALVDRHHDHVEIKDILGGVLYDERLTVSQPSTETTSLTGTSI